MNWRCPTWVVRCGKKPLWKIRRFDSHHMTRADSSWGIKYMVHKSFSCLTFDFSFQFWVFLSIKAWVVRRGKKLWSIHQMLWPTSHCPRWTLLMSSVCKRFVSNLPRTDQDHWLFNQEVFDHDHSEEDLALSSLEVFCFWNFNVDIFLNEARSSVVVESNRKCEEESTSSLIRNGDNARS